MRRGILLLVPVLLALYYFGPQLEDRFAFATEARSVPVKQPTNDAAALELRWQQLVEKEAALKAKEESLAKLAATLNARVVELNSAKKGIEAALAAKRAQDDERAKARKKLEDERYKRMIKIYKSLKAEDAGTLMNKLDAKLVIDMLNQMDQKTAVKLVPFLSQPRVLEWTRLNLSGAR